MAIGTTSMSGPESSKSSGQVIYEGQGYGQKNVEFDTQPA
jgi:hypothetical protein